MREIGWKRMAIVLGGFALAGFCFYIGQNAGAFSALTGAIAIVAPAALRAAKE